MSPATRAEPKPDWRLCSWQTALPSPSTTTKQVVSSGGARRRAGGRRPGRCPAGRRVGDRSAAGARRRTPWRAGRRAGRRRSPGRRGSARGRRRPASWPRPSGGSPRGVPAEAPARSKPSTRFSSCSRTWPLELGGALVDGVAPVGGADRLLPAGAEGGQVLERMAPAVLLREGVDGAGDGARGRSSHGRARRGRGRCAPGRAAAAPRRPAGDGRRARRSARRGEGAELRRRRRGPRRGRR